MSPNVAGKPSCVTIVSMTDTDVMTSTRAALGVCQRVLRDVRAGDLRKPTPCSEYDVAQLADHLVKTIRFFGTLAGAQFPAGEAEAGEADAQDEVDLEGLITGVAQGTLEAWGIRGLGGTVRMRGSDLPADFALSILCVELLVHAWDFGQALDRRVVVNEPLAEEVLGMARATVTPDLRDRGSFAAPAAAGPDAPAFDQLIAFTGRTS